MAAALWRSVRSRFAALLVLVAGCAVRDSGSHASPDAGEPDAGSATLPSGLTVTVPEPAGPNCPNGGVAIESGLDHNLDGSLEPDEVMSTQYVCTPPPDVTLVRVDAEPSGDNCSCGGVAISTGIDTNDNGVLDDDEVSSVSYACKACDELQAIAVEPPGPNCVSGGFAIETGLDSNGDGILDPPEVAHTTYQCSPGPWTMRLDSDVAGHCAGAGTSVLSGLDSNGNGALDDNEIITRADICQPDERVPQLVRLDREGSGGLCAEAGWLVPVGFDLDDDGALQDDEADTLVPICNHAGIPSILRAEDPGTACAAGGTALATGTDADGNGALEDDEVLDIYPACAPVHRSVAGDVIVYGKPDLHDLLGVRSIDGSLTIAALGLSHVRIPDLETITGSITCGAGAHSACGQTILALPWLSTVEDVTVHAPQLLSLDLRRLHTAHDVDIEGTPVGFSVALSSLTTCDVLGLYFGHVAALDASALQACRVELSVQDLTTVALPGLTTGAFDAQDCDVATVSLPAFHDGILAVRSTRLHDLWAPVFSSGLLSIEGNDPLETISLPAFASSSYVAISGNPRLTALSLPALTHADELDLVNNYMLPTCQALELWTRLGHPIGTVINNNGTGSCP